MAAIAASPALAFGPPGWVVFALAVVATVAVAGVVGVGGAALVNQAQNQSKAQSEAKPGVIVQCPASTSEATKEKKQKRPWSIRVHAQGTDIGGTTGSTVGAPPIVQMSPILVAQGVALAAATFALLTARQQNNLQLAYAKCVNFIQTCGGFLGSKSFYGRSRDNNRFDLDSYGPSNNLVA